MRRVHPERHLPFSVQGLTMPGFAVIEAPSVLGLFPRGVERLPDALLGAGLADALDARRAGRVEPPPYDPRRDPATGLLNPTGLRDYAHQLADTTGEVLDGGEMPIVLGGDCSILLGNLLALSRRGRHGLLFLDGHADFYQPEAEPNGEAASMDLALATGRGPSVVADLDGRGALVRDEDVVVLGRRDAEEAEAAGSRRIEDTEITVFDLPSVRERGAARAASDAVEHLGRPDLDGFWIHVDCDVLDDAVMPAVDYRLPGGLSWDELETVLAAAIATSRAVGLELTIFNPALDTDGVIIRTLVAGLGRVLGNA
jgi:arginase